MIELRETAVPPPPDSLETTRAIISASVLSEMGSICAIRVLIGWEDTSASFGIAGGAVSRR